MKGQRIFDWTAGQAALCLCCILMTVHVAACGTTPASPAGAADSADAEVAPADASEATDTAYTPDIADTFDASAADTDTSPAADATMSTACAVKVTALAAEIYAKPQSCSAIVRLDWDTYAPGPWSLACGPAVDVSEAAASATALATFDASGLPPGAQPGKAKNLPNPSDVYVFTVEPTDFGSLSVVSARTGLPLLAAKLNWSAPAKLTYPTTWRDAALLGAGCRSAIPLAPHRVYDFAGDSLDPTAADISKALDAVADTPLFAAFASQGKLLDIVLIRLQRTVDGSSQATSTSEWVAIVDGGVVK